MWNLHSDYNTEIKIIGIIGIVHIFLKTKKGK
jgi:hypothetical protein